MHFLSVVANAYEQVLDTTVREYVCLPTLCRKTVLRARAQCEGLVHRSAAAGRRAAELRDGGVIGRYDGAVFDVGIAGVVSPAWGVWIGDGGKVRVEHEVGGVGACGADLLGCDW